MIIERDDVLAILNSHFGEEFDVENIEMPKEFEIIVKGIPLPPSARRSARPVEEPVRARPARPSPAEDVSTLTASPEEEALVSKRADADASVDPPPPGMDDTEALGASGSPLSLIEQSRRLEAQLERETPRRRQGGQSTFPHGHEEVT